MIALPLLHDCRDQGEWLRHRTTIACREVSLNSGKYRYEGTRCDGTPIHAIGSKVGQSIVIDPCTTYDERLMVEGDHSWRSISGGPWEPLIDFGEQPEDEPVQDDLFGSAS